MPTSYEIENNDFISLDILLKFAKMDCKNINKQLKVVYLPMSKYRYIDKDNKLEIIYENKDYKFVSKSERIPVKYPPHIYFIKICCKRHFSQIDHNIIITNKYTNTKYKVNMKEEYLKRK
ncbi:hypothetical protein A0H76_2692 [Hepatospora eriocheir]|uniref:Uncharacterized protein n=1 Tax=Hepatospora eriocheir TaxID=1081669 RepID=A0A1X0QJK1_9MICR|nr:hypothetical protein A0H76_2692 [Hepatospora eriocheir]